MKTTYILQMSIILSVMSLSACQQEPAEGQAKRQVKQMNPEEAAMMAQSIEAVVKPELDEGLTLKLWAVDSLVADPVAIDMDDQGRLYYSRTTRRKSTEIDIRGHQDWETASIRMQTVDDKRDFLQSTLTAENSEKNKWLGDLNGDGINDWRDLTVESEQIYRLEDVSGDGIADLSELMVEGFRDELTDVAGAVLAHGEDIFVGVAPDMWRIKDTNGDGIADEKTSISHGYGVHIGFGGHNMSGLEMGPDGRIYWAIGDIGFNGKGADGTEWKYPNRGVIVRANPDGSDFEVFAMGLRNTHEFVFDEYANLISQDNDGDHRGESERLVYVTNGSDTGWRINWQFGKYRDPDNNDYKVWMDEEMYKPRWEGQPAYITPTIANFVNGPTGMLYNPGTALSPEWKNTFFVVEFVGNPARSGIHSFKLKPKGATFELGEHKKILGNVLATGIDFGPDGAMYVADWIDGWNTKDYGRVWKLDVKSGADEAARAEVKKLLGEDFTEREEAALGELLSHADQRVRQKAQFELAKRGGAGAETFEEAIIQTEHQLARVHGIWGLAQMARLENMDYAQSLVPLLSDSDEEIRAQAAKWLGDIRYKEAADEIMPLLEDDAPRARFFAAEALGRMAHAPAVDGLIALLQSNNDEDAYIRHAASLALARIGDAEAVVALHDHPSRAVRMGAVLALRRLSHEGIVNFLDDKDEYIVTEAARAINDDFSIELALPALGDVLTNPRFTQEPLIRRAINANLRVGTDKAMNNLISYALRENAPTEMRAEAVAALGTWHKPSVLDRVTGRYRGPIERDPADLKNNASDMLIKLANHREKDLRLSAINAIGRTDIDAGVPHLYALLRNDREPQVRIEALQSLAKMEDPGEEFPEIAQAIELALADREKSVRVSGLDLLAKTDLSEELMVSLLQDVINTRTVEEKQAALLTLGNISPEFSQSTLEELLGRLDAGKLPAEIQLELAEAIDSTHSSQLIARLEEIQSRQSPDDVLAAYQSALYGGDAERGQRILYRHPTAQCIRCHAYGDYGGNAGPRLDGIGSKLSREQILESIINPSARLAPGYGVVTVDLKSGRKISGILQGENAEELMVKVGSQPDTVIMKADIVERTNAASSMPDMKNFLTKKEIRDLVNLLATFKEEEI
jgi:putative heme-binding domain-containing protein